MLEQATHHAKSIFVTDSLLNAKLFWQGQAKACASANCDLFKLIFDKNLKCTNNLNFKKMIEDNLKGDSSIVFDKIYLDLSSELSKSIILDFINLNILMALDFILSMYQKVFNKNSTQFDYSLFFHKVSDKLKLITQNINNKY